MHIRLLWQRCQFSLDFPWECIIWNQETCHKCWFSFTWPINLHNIIGLIINLAVINHSLIYTESMSLISTTFRTKTPTGHKNISVVGLLTLLIRQMCHRRTMIGVSPTAPLNDKSIHRPITTFLPRIRAPCSYSAHWMKAEQPYKKSTERTLIFPL